MERLVKYLKMRTTSYNESECFNKQVLDLHVAQAISGHEICTVDMPSRRHEEWMKGWHGSQWKHPSFQRLRCFKSLQERHPSPPITEFLLWFLVTNGEMAAGFNCRFYIFANVFDSLLALTLVMPYIWIPFNLLSFTWPLSLFLCGFAYFWLSRGFCLAFVEIVINHWLLCFNKLKNISILFLWSRL